MHTERFLLRFNTVTISCVGSELRETNWFQRNKKSITYLLRNLVQAFYRRPIERKILICAWNRIMMIGVVDKLIMMSSWPTASLSREDCETLYFAEVSLLYGVYAYWGMMAHWYSRCLSTERSRVRIPLYSRHVGILASPSLAVACSTSACKLRHSVRSTIEIDKYNTIYNAIKKSVRRFLIELQLVCLFDSLMW